ncbi:MAG: alpha/beta hydrolase [Pseudomonadota bacterium]
MLRETTLRTDRHETFYLAAGPEDGTPLIFVHGWPELSLSWRGQLPVFGGLGFRAVAPDMRGYGRSAVHAAREAYALEEAVADMVELLDHLGAETAVWVGHDWGAPVVWAMAQQHPERVEAAAGLCVPYLPEGLSVESAAPLADRELYPEDRCPAAQWDYQLFYRESLDAAVAAFEADPAKSVRALFRAGRAGALAEPSPTASVRARGGWFDGGPAPAAPLDTRVLSEAEAAAYAEALGRNGFRAPAYWYLNGEANAAYAARARDRWRLEMPVLFLHAAHDAVCETLPSRLARPMRAHCADLTETVIASGHWMAQERPAEVNAALARWLAVKRPDLWRVAPPPSGGQGAADA